MHVAEFCRGGQVEGKGDCSTADCFHRSIRDTKFSHERIYLSISVSASVGKANISDARPFGDVYTGRKTGRMVT